MGSPLLVVGTGDRFEPELLVAEGKDGDRDSAGVGGVVHASKSASRKYAGAAPVLGITTHPAPVIVREQPTPGEGL